MRDINQVLSEHDKALLAIPGVVGVYVGQLEPEGLPCLRVMVVRKTAKLRRMLPEELEGYRLEIEETGVIHPMCPNE